VLVLAAGFCQAALQALRFVTRDMQKEVVGMLVVFSDVLAPHLVPAAEADLLAGNAMELVVQAMVQEDHPHQNYVTMLVSLSLNPAAEERMCAPGIVDQQMKWVAKWLLKVCQNTACRAHIERERRHCVLLFYVLTSPESRGRSFPQSAFFTSAAVAIR
jgi:hypothetical protein